MYLYDHNRKLINEPWCPEECVEYSCAEQQMQSSDDCTAWGVHVCHCAKHDRRKRVFRLRLQQSNLTEAVTWKSNWTMGWTDCRASNMAKKPTTYRCQLEIDPITFDNVIDFHLYIHIHILFHEIALPLLYRNVLCIIST